MLTKLPEKSPVLKFTKNAWNKQLIKKVHARVVEVAYKDTNETDEGIAFNDDAHLNSVKLLRTDGHVVPIDSPSQVIYIGSTLDEIMINQNERSGIVLGTWRV